MNRWTESGKLGLLRCQAVIERSGKFTRHAVHDLLELGVAVGRVVAGGALQDVLDAAEAEALVGDTLLKSQSMF